MRFVNERVFWSLPAVWLFSLVAGIPAWAQAPEPPPVPAKVQEAMRLTEELIQVPVQVHSQYDYIMTGRVRFLLFWIGKDDVGGGYIRRGALPNQSGWDVIELLIGSDPVKAPRAINRWGAATEIVHTPACCGRVVDASEFLGFMKVSSGVSASEMERELANEKQAGAFLFSAIINHGTRSSAIAKVVPISSDTDFTFREFGEAKSMVFDRLLGPQGHVQQIPPDELQACSRPEGFLKSVAELIDAAVEQHKPPVSLCYFYNGQRHQLTLAQVSHVPRETIQLSLRDQPQPYVRTYQDLALARFENVNQRSRKKSEFRLLLGTKGDLRGVPVQIRYQPNWWFQVVLNLITAE